MVVGWNGIRTCPKLKCKNVMLVVISVGIGSIKEIDCAWEDVDVLLNILIGACLG